MESPAFTGLVFVAFGLLLAVSGGVAYLTVIDWRDRRRREQDSREDNSTSNKTAGNKTASNKTTGSRPKRKSK